MDPTGLATSLLTGEPNITGFYHWHLFTDDPIPMRRDNESNLDYTRKHWFKLVEKVNQWQRLQQAIPQ